MVYHLSTIYLDSGIHSYCCFHLFVTLATYYMTSVNWSVARTSQCFRRCSLKTQMTQMVMEQYSYLTIEIKKWIFKFEKKKNIHIFRRNLFKRNDSYGNLANSRDMKWICIVCANWFIYALRVWLRLHGNNKKYNQNRSEFPSDVALRPYSICALPCHSTM